MAPSRINYDIRIVKESDHQAILDHFWKHFFRETPLSNYFRIVTDTNPVCEDLKAEVMKCLDNPSQNLVAVHDGEIIGVSLHKVQDKDDRESEEEFKNEKVAVIEEFVNFCVSDARPFDQYPGCQKAFLVRCLSVDPAYRRCGVARALVSKSVELAKKFGCGVVTVNCASLYSALVFENLGFKMIFEQAYEDYLVKGDYITDEEFRENGKIVLRPKEPHKSMKVYVKRVV